MKSALLLGLLIISLLRPANLSAQSISFAHEEDLQPEFSVPNFLALKKSENKWRVVTLKFSDAHKASPQLKALGVEMHKLVFLYDKSGQGIMAFHNPEAPSRHPLGVMINTDTKLRGKFGVIKNFLFNDPYQDFVSHPQLVSCVDELQVTEFVAPLGKLFQESNLGKYKFAYEASYGFNASQDSKWFNAMDFTTQIPDSCLHVIEGAAYNKKDAGNVIWGRAMKEIGFTYSAVRLASEVNGVFFTRTQNRGDPGIILRGDSNADQRAIKNGYHSNASLTESSHAGTSTQTILGTSSPKGGSR